MNICSLQTATILGVISAACALHAQTALDEYNARLKASPLRQWAVAAGGQFQQVGSVNGAKLFQDLPSMMKASDEVVLVHILKSSCQLSPSGRHLFTVYHATIIRQIMGSWNGTTVFFSIPTGAFQFDALTRASTVIPGLGSLTSGRRYLLFLRWASSDERDFTPGLRLTGEGVQGAFELDDESVVPGYSKDPLSPVYNGIQVSRFLDEVQGLSGREKR